VVETRSFPKLIVLLPIYNEAATLEGILRRVSRVADQMVLVDDGSRDATARILERFATGRSGVFILSLPVNRGMAGALEAGFRFVLHLLETGRVSEKDILAMLDADGQHRPENLPEGRRRLVKDGLDVLLTRRDFHVYPLYKVWGNRFLTWTNRLLSDSLTRRRVGDAFIRVGPCRRPKVLPGQAYSCAQEIALLSHVRGFGFRMIIWWMCLVTGLARRFGTALWSSRTVSWLSVAGPWTVRCAGWMRPLSSKRV
jgi:glycosyltransferase involved in cell wall biosynthesis